jgi:hypothetical protein
MPPLRLSRLVLTVFYLTGPLLIVSELFKPVFAVPVILLFLLWVPLTFSSRFRPEATERPRPTILSLAAGLFALALSFVWVFFSGIGSYALCRWDYVKHNMLFSYLLDQRLPITILLDGTNHILHYSMAYYITPVRLYQSLAWLVPDASLNFILLIMYSAALFLSFRLLAGRRPVFLLALLAVASLSGGLDLLGMVATGVAPESAPVPSLDIRILYNLEWWGVPFAPQSLTMNLFYAPQHFFGALIGTALLCASLRSDQPLAVSLVEVVIIIAASVFWSPYVAVGLAVLAVVLLFGLDEQGTFFRRMKQEGFAALLPLRGLVSGAFAIALTLAGGLFLTAAVSLSPPRFLVSAAKVLPWSLTYAMNYAPLLVALAFASWPGAWKADRTDALGNPKRRQRIVRILAAGLCASAALLLVTHGLYNDWAMRATLPLSIALAVVLTHVLLGGLAWPYLAVLLTVLVVSSASSLTAFVQSAFMPTHCQSYGRHSLKDMGELKSQYVGRSDSFLYRYFVRSR